MKQTVTIGLEIGCLIVAVLSVICNGALLAISIKLRLQAKVKLTVFLSTINLIIVGIVGLAMTINLAEPKILNSVILCQLKGWWDFFSLTVSMITVSAVAKERLNLISMRLFSRRLIASYVISSLILILSLTATASQNQYHRIGKSSQCNLNEFSATSLVSLTLFSFSFVTWFLLTLVCYGLNLRSKLRTPEYPLTGVIDNQVIGKLKQRNTNLGVRFLSVPIHSPQQSKVIRRIVITLLAYFILIVTAFSLIFWQIFATYSYPVGGLATLLITLANPCLALFAHSNIFQNLPF